MLLRESVLRTILTTTFTVKRDKPGLLVTSGTARAHFCILYIDVVGGCCCQFNFFRHGVLKLGVVWEIAADKNTNHLSITHDMLDVHDVDAYKNKQLQQKPQE
jgi:hypothetical protein